MQEMDFIAQVSRYISEETYVNTEKRKERLKIEALSDGEGETRKILRKKQCVLGCEIVFGREKGGSISLW